MSISSGFQFQHHGHLCLIRDRPLMIWGRASGRELAMSFFFSWPTAWWVFFSRWKVGEFFFSRICPSLTPPPIHYFGAKNFLCVVQSSSKLSCTPSPFSPSVVIPKSTFCWESCSISYPPTLLGMCPFFLGHWHKLFTQRSAASKNVCFFLEIETNIGRPLSRAQKLKKIICKGFLRQKYFISKISSVPPPRSFIHEILF